MEHGLRADPATLMRIKNLQLRAKRIVDGFQSGLHRSPRQGFSVEFSEYRPFVPGDDPRAIDWKLFARSDRYYLKKFEDETNRRCHLVVDQSRSMDYGSIGYSKLDYARTLAATLAYFLTRQRDAVGMLTFESRVTGMVPARFRHGHLRRLLHLLEQATGGESTDLQRPLIQLAELVKHRGLMIIFSDFLVPLEPILQPLAYLTARHHEIILVRILDPQELDFSLSQPTVLRDLESGQEMYLDPPTANRIYRERFTRHAEQLSASAAQLGCSSLTLSTRQPFELALADLIHGHEQRASQGHGVRSPSLDARSLP